MTQHLSRRALAALSLLFPDLARAEGQRQNLTRGLAIQGYDPVAYFTEGRARRGRYDIRTQWNGATWRFANAEHRRMFLADPERYAPAFGGFCAYAVSEGYTATVDPTAFRIVEGRLFLNYSHAVQARWEEDRAARIQRGEANWPGLSAR
ncbi:YHS domain-containing (seleno)protein [Rhodovarius lipocyclicus]|uniref:YHS domain-containing (seleno)protein n=1 Tax=Rhodovarius lipocyclicus TaxID=268410 RepID=UPI00135BD00F|nr:YHS domain-containing (seleno)protein [Rhodovarius lipocyclicus]